MYFVMELCEGKVPFEKSAAIAHSIMKPCLPHQNLSQDVFDRMLEQEDLSYLTTMPGNRVVLVPLEEQGAKIIAHNA